MTDREWLEQLMTPDDEQLYAFIERVGIILDSIENPTEKEINEARNKAFLDTL
jgi:hypothetical protein